MPAAPPDIRKESKQIGDFTYTVQCLDPETAFDVFVDVVQDVLPALAIALGSLEEGGLTALRRGAVKAALGDGNLERAVERFVRVLDKAKTKNAMKAFAARTEVAGVGMLAQNPMHFAGRFDAQLTWFGFCMWMQYKDFFATSMPEMKNLSENMLGLMNESTGQA
jgi:hypothetical protein